MATFISTVYKIREFPWRYSGPPVLTPVSEFYTAQSLRFGPSGVLEHHRERARRLDTALAGRVGARVLELGAGAGGTATATAELGYLVTAIELSPLRASFARALSTLPIIVEGDFYVADLGSGYDAVVYWNGFGMNKDADQRRLLHRVSNEWLTKDGVMILDVFNPAWWARTPNDVRTHPEYKACQQTTFDAEGQRFVDRWWPIDAEHEAISQSIRCYAPCDLELLLEGTGLKLAFLDDCDFTESYSYRAVLTRTSARLG